jgi:hypothetical protein
MIHQAARTMAIAHLGEDGWAAFLKQNALGDEHFIGVEYYEDAETMRLVELIAARLELPADDALREFGHHWIAFAGSSAYGRILSMAGDDLAGFLDNLDRMHASIKSTMPLARMPSFQVLENGGDAMKVLYRSERSGLAAFVEGILSAVARSLGEEVTISRPEPDRDDGTVAFLIERSADT